MTTVYFTSRLAPLASTKVQEQYGVSGSISQHVLAAELLEGAAECVSKVRELHSVAESLSAAAKTRILALGQLLQADIAVGLEDKPWSELIHNPQWACIRVSAKSALIELGFDLATWEREECMRPNTSLERTRDR